MKVFSLQAPIYRGAWLSSRLTAQTSQLAAVRRDALERWPTCWFVENNHGRNAFLF